MARKKLKIKLLRKDGRIQTYRLTYSNFYKKIRSHQYEKVSFNKKLRKWVWHKVEPPKPPKKQKPKSYEIHIKLSYENIEKPYKNIYIDGFATVTAKNKLEAEQFIRDLIASYFNPEIAEMCDLKVEQLKEIPEKNKMEILYRNKKKQPYKVLEYDI